MKDDFDIEFGKVGEAEELDALDNAGKLAGIWDDPKPKKAEKEEERPWDFRGRKPVGFWKPPSFYPDPHDFVNEDWDEAEKQLVLDHIESDKHERVGCFGWAPCRMCDKVDNGVYDIWDSEWIWPEGLAHYIREHAVKPPQEFIDHCKKMNG